MGNCQAIDAATLVIQHPSGKLDKLYFPVTASEIMRTNPGHYVALLITTTVFHPTATSTSTATTTQPNFPTKKTAIAVTKDQINNTPKADSSTVRVTRVKLLRPTDILALGHAYRLISTQEVMKGMVAKKQAKMRKDGFMKSEPKEVAAAKDAAAAAERLTRKPQQLDRDNQGVKRERHHRPRTGAAAAVVRTRTTAGTVGRARTWQPSLRSISEAAGT